MIDLLHLEKYQENNRIEAKKALGGLPKSIWETYSAFANTFGGILLLGVEELSDGSLAVANGGIFTPDTLINEFWDIINNPKKVSVNILSDKDVYVQEIDGKNIIVINIPRADRAYRPVYVDGNPISGTYRRNGEGDYKCTQEEYLAMLRDASIKTQDMFVLEEMDLDVFNEESIKGYRMRMNLLRPNHVWGALDNEEFLFRIGAIGIGKDGKKHPTSAGLLMFGNEYCITREFNNYFLDYQEKYDPNIRWTDRIVSSSGDWSGNVYDFYFRVYNKLTQDLKVPFAMKSGVRIDETPVHEALREALANCLVNADYYGRQGVVIIKSKEDISLSNPGGFRIEIDAAKSGGVSDPRNSAMLKMFNLINIGERAGSGISNIMSIWEQQKWSEPTITQTFEPERTTLTLSIKDKKLTRVGDKKSAITESVRQIIVEYLTDHVSASCAEIASALSLQPSRTRDYLSALVSEDIIVAEGANRNRRYRLKK